MKNHPSHLQSTWLGEADPKPQVPGEVICPSPGLYVPSPVLAQCVIPQRICDGMCYHPSGDIRKRRVGTSRLSWTVETFTNLEAGGRIHCHFSALRFGNCLAWVMQLSKSFTGIFQNFKLSIKKQTNNPSLKYSSLSLNEALDHSLHILFGKHGPDKTVTLCLTHPLPPPHTHIF